MQRRVISASVAFFAAIYAAIAWSAEARLVGDGAHVYKVNSSQKQIRVERFDPPSDGKSAHPCVLLIHGADGLSSEEWRRRYYKYADNISRHGYVVLLPHYLESTNTDAVNSINMIFCFPAWTQCIKDTIGSVQNDKTVVDAGHVGLIGFSLGASMALSVGTTDNRVAALVEEFGAFPDASIQAVTHVPPVLALHGDSDFMVNVKESAKLENLENHKFHGVFEKHIFAGQGHGFSGKSEDDAITYSLDFFARHLPKHMAALDPTTESRPHVSASNTDPGNESEAVELKKWIETLQSFARHPLLKNNRIAGAPGEAEAANWLVAKLKSFGFINARKEPFPITAWLPSKWSISLAGTEFSQDKPGSFSSAYPIFYTAFTDAGGSEAAMQYCGSGHSEDFSNVRGKIAVVDLSLLMLRLTISLQR